MCNQIRIPAEWELHNCCWMAWAVHREWGHYLDSAKLELRNVILTIASHELVKLITPPDLVSEATSQFSGKNVEVVPAPVDDIWMRDILPPFAFRGDTIVLIDWNFNGWDSTSSRPTRTGDRLSAFLSSATGMPMITAPFVAEAGAIATDGQGTIVTTKSCLSKRNPGPQLGHTVAERMQRIDSDFSKMGGRKVIWLDGDVNEPITNGHADGYVLFTESGSILVEGSEKRNENETRSKDISILQRTTDARGRKNKVKVVLPPRKQHWRFSGRFFAPCYLNAYVTNGAVITGKFGDPERDELARLALQESFPAREIHMPSIDHIAPGGGGIHCLVQPQPELRNFVA